MPGKDRPLSPDLLLRQAAEGDAARAAELLAYVAPTKLLDAVLTQAELAVDEERTRPAGIDAIAELDRASIEVMDLPQGADLSLDLEQGAELMEEGSDDPGEGFGWGPDDDRLLRSPVLIGWELVTVEPSQLASAVLTLPTRPWHLSLVAFADHTDLRGARHRQVTAAAADGRLIAADLRFTSPDDDPDVLGAVVTRDTRDLGSLGRLAASLRAALEAAARGIG